MTAYQARAHYTGDVASDYVRARAHDPKWQREQRAMRLALAALPSGRVILDVPFGTGRFAEFYLAGAHSVVGADVSGDMLAQAAADQHVRALAPRLLRADAERLPLADASVDCVVCTRLLNWVPADVVARMLGEFRRVARSELLLQIRVAEQSSASEFAWSVAATVARHPRHAALRLARAAMRTGRGASAHLLGRWRRRAGGPPPTYPQGYVVPTASELHALFAAHGLEVREVTPVHTVYDVRTVRRKELRLYRLRVVPV